jgi:hypothetical protein
LGSAGRFAELLAANRNVLPSSDMLPIGVVIRIPPAESAAIPSVAEKSQEEDNRFRHLVPIPSGALSP